MYKAKSLRLFSAFYLFFFITSLLFYSLEFVNAKSSGLKHLENDSVSFMNEGEICGPKKIKSTTLTCSLDTECKKCKNRCECAKIKKGPLKLGLSLNHNHDWLTPSLIYYLACFNPIHFYDSKTSHISYLAYSFFHPPKSRLL